MLCAVKAGQETETVTLPWAGAAVDLLDGQAVEAEDGALTLELPPLTGRRRPPPQKKQPPSVCRDTRSPRAPGRGGAVFSARNQRLTAGKDGLIAKNER